jgi:hypothetical protein
MFGNIGQLASLLKNAGQIKENMRLMQERLKAGRFVGDAGAGQARATVDGRGEPIALKLDPALLAAGDAELIEELVCAAFRDAIARSREAVAKEMQTATGMELPGLTDMLG